MRSKITLSLVSATLLATTLSAKPLSEAIQSIDTSGSINYRYNDYETSKKTGNTTNQYKLALNVNAKVDDDFKVNTRFVVTNKFGWQTKEADKEIEATLSEVNFAYSGIKNTIITLGKQAMSSPWTMPRDFIDDENAGTGVAVVYADKYISATAAFFNQTNFNNAEITNWNGLAGITGAEDFSYFTLSGTLANTTLNVGYANLKDVFDSYTVGLNGAYTLGSVSLNPFARYTSLKSTKEHLNRAGHTDNSLAQIGLFATAGIYSLFTAYGETGKDGGNVSIDTGSQVNMDYGWRITASNEADAKYFYISTFAQAFENWNFGVGYTRSKFGADSVAYGSDQENVFTQIRFKMLKKIDAYLRYGTLQTEDIGTGVVGRLNMIYSF